MGIQAGSTKKRSWLATTGLYVVLIAFGFTSVMMFAMTAAAASSTFTNRANGTAAEWIALAFISGLTAGCIWFTYRVARRLFRPGSRRLPKRTGNPFVCNSCGCEAPTIQASFHKHMGAIVMMFHSSVQGHFCRACISRTFGRWSLLTLALGWWGMLSVIITPIVLINNLVMYVRSRSMPGSAENAIAPVMTESDVYRVHEIHGHIVEQLRSGMALDELSTEVSQMVGVTPGQAYIYVAKLHEMEPAIADQTAPATLSLTGSV